jgi:hypothetical protein
MLNESQNRAYLLIFKFYGVQLGAKVKGTLGNNPYNLTSINHERNFDTHLVFIQQFYLNPFLITGKSSPVS